MAIDYLKAGGSVLDAAINTGAILADEEYNLSKPFERAKDWAALGVTVAGGAIAYMEDNPNSQVERIGEGMFYGGIPLLGESLLHLAKKTIAEAFPDQKRKAFELRQRGQPPNAERKAIYSQPSQLADVSVLTG